MKNGTAVVFLFDSSGFYDGRRKKWYFLKFHGSKFHWSIHQNEMLENQSLYHRLEQDGNTGNGVCDR